MAATYPTKIILAFRSGGCCAMPDCRRELTPDSEAGNAYTVGVAAHIAGEKAGAARFDPSMTDAVRDEYKNLIYVCSECHIKIDDKQQGEKLFPTDRLRILKKEHEARVRLAVDDAFADVGFPELAEATQWVVNSATSSANRDFSLIPLDQKLKKNELGAGSVQTITMGLAVSPEVKAYIEVITQTENDFPERLKVGFLQEYYRLKGTGISGDDLFDSMCNFAQRGCKKQQSRSAALAVLIYLFEACEVFEK